VTSPVTGPATGPVPPVRVHVSDTVVARVAEMRARQVPGVVALRGDRTGAQPWSRGRAVDGVDATVRGGAAVVSVAVVTRLGHNCREVAQAVQREVAREVTSFTGIAATVTVTVADVLME
jgi:uncharacterized alkaline shock family protein YloU